MILVWLLVGVNWNSNSNIIFVLDLNPIWVNLIIHREFAPKTFQNSMDEDEKKILFRIPFNVYSLDNIMDTRISLHSSKGEFFFSLIQYLLLRFNFQWGKEWEKGKISFFNYFIRWYLLQRAIELSQSSLHWHEKKRRKNISVIDRILKIFSISFNWVYLKIVFVVCMLFFGAGDPETRDEKNESKIFSIQQQQWWSYYLKIMCGPMNKYNKIIFSFHERFFS